MHDGQPMQLEVLKDQYEKVLKGFEQKIKDGKVPGVTDPKDAEKFVRKGRLTYQQAVNLSKPRTIESLTYDALTGAVICSCAMGLTFVVTVFLTWRKIGDIREAVQAGTAAGLQMFGLSFVQHMLVSQIARTSLANSLLTPSRYLVGKLGYQASATIVNGIRALSGIVYYKRLEFGSFQWPRSETEARVLTPQQYRWLMEGLSIDQPKAHKGVNTLEIV